MSSLVFSEALLLGGVELSEFETRERDAVARELDPHTVQVTLPNVVTFSNDVRRLLQGSGGVDVRGRHHVVVVGIPGSDSSWPPHLTALSRRS